MNSKTVKFSVFPSEQLTISDVFIIEALTAEDVRQGMLDGYILYQQIKLMGGDPRYIRVKSENDLKAALVMFRESNYKFLHVSCHGDRIKQKIRIGEKWFGYMRVAIASRQLLKSRRVTFSACELGDELFCKRLFEKNHWMHSFTAPTTEINAKVASAFWVSLYTLWLNKSIPSVKDDLSVRSDTVLDVLKILSNAFDFPILFAYPDTIAKVIRMKKVSKGRISEEPRIPFSSVKPERYSRRSNV